MTYSCNANSAPPCANFYGCGYDGDGVTVSACTTYTETSKHVLEKHYRLSSAIAVNNDKGGRG